MKRLPGLKTYTDIQSIQQTRRRQPPLLVIYKRTGGKDCQESAGSSCPQSSSPLNATAKRTEPSFHWVWSPSRGPKVDLCSKPTDVELGLEAELPPTAHSRQKRALLSWRWAEEVWACESWLWAWALYHVLGWYHAAPPPASSSAWIRTIAKISWQQEFVPSRKQPCSYLWYQRGSATNAAASLLLKPSLSQGERCTAGHTENVVHGDADLIKERY